MAKIKWSQFGITNASGKSGGTIFSHNRAGAYVKRWAKPVNAQTASQQAMRSLFGNVAQNWGQLTEPQIKAWEAAAQNIQVVDGFGDTRNMTGYTYFVSANQNRVHGMGLQITKVPLKHVPLPSASFDQSTPNINNGALTDNMLEITFHGGFPTTIYTASIAYCALNPGQRRNYGSLKNKFKRMSRIQFTTDGSGAATVNVTNAIGLQQLPELTAGQQIYFQLHIHSNAGQKSAPVVASGVVIDEP